MDMQQSLTGQYISQTDHSGTFGLEGTQENRNDFHGELFENLKRNYEQRIQELEHHIKETYQLVENDEIIQTMQMNHVSENFKQQRIQEIIEDSIGGEKEAQIEKLNYANALLKTELGRIDQENQKIVQLYNQEVAKFNKTISDFKNALQVEVKAKNQLQQECENLTNKLNIFAQQHEEIVKQRGGADSKLQNELNRLVQENQNLKKQREEYDRTNKQKDELIEEMRKDMEILKNEYIELENANHCLNSDQNEYADILAAFKEKKIQDEAEIQKLKDILRKMEEDSRDTKQELDRTLQENSELIAKSEYISSQVKKLVESGQKNTNEMIEEVKQKYKVKTEELKRRLEEATSTNESLKNEIFNLSSELKTTRLNSEKLVVQFQSDLKLVKNEWYKKCQEIEIKSQKELTEAQAKHQETINKLQMEYQQLIQKKVKDAQNEAKEEIAQIRIIEKETRAQLEAKVARFEKDFMLKSTHESTLAAEVLSLKTNQMQVLKELEDRFERDYTAKLRDINEKSRIEYENNLSTLKSQNKYLEQQLSTIKTESQQVLEGALKEKDKSQRLEIELKEVRLIENRLKEELEEVQQNLSRSKMLYDEEVRKVKKKELEFEDILHRTEHARLKEGEFSEILNASRDEITELKDLLVIQNQRLSQAISQEKSLKEEIGILKISLETNETEKKSLIEKIAELEYDLTIAKEKENENQMFGTHKLQESLTQTEGKVKTLIKELTMKEESVNLLNRNVKELKEMLERNQERVEELENEREKLRGANKELLRKSELGEMENKKRANESIRLVYRELNSMKQQVNRLKNGCKVEIEHSKDIMKELILDFENEVQTKINQSKRMDAFGQETRKLTEEIQSLQYEVQEWRAKSEEATKKIMEYERIIKKLEEGESKMKEESNRKVEEFRNFQEFVQTELKRIKEESENGTKQLVWRHKQDIHRIMLNLEELKGKRLERMMKIEDEVIRMERESERNIEEMEAWYEKKIRDYEKSSIEAADELISLRKEIVALEENNNKLKEDNKNMVDSLDEKLNIVRDIMTREKQNNDKLQESKEVERLRHTVRDLMIENTVKEEKIKELTKSAETNRDREEKNKTISSDRDWEVIEVKKNREREMEELQNLLAKTMNEVGRKSSRLEGKPERDTQGTGRRKSSTMKGNDYGRFSEKPDSDDH